MRAVGPGGRRSVLGKILQLVACAAFTGLISIGLLPHTAAAQDSTDKVHADSLVVQGNKRVADKRIRDIASIPLNDVTYPSIQRAIRALMETGDFERVDVLRRDKEDRLWLILNVVERPL